MYFKYKDNQLYWKDESLDSINKHAQKILLKRYNYRGPYFLYHNDILEERLDILSGHFPESKLFYSVKSLSNIHILKKIREKENFGIDVVSGGEILRGLQAGFPGSRMVYAGVGKTENEIVLGLQNGIKSFHVESLSEIQQISEIASILDISTQITIRLNPDIGVDTHEYIKTGKEENKFGISERELAKAMRLISESDNLSIIGLQVHLGSQIMNIEPYLDGLEFLKEKAVAIESYLQEKLEYLSLGGGFGIDYDYIFSNEKGKNFPIEKLSKEINSQKLPWRVDFEPGRFLTGYTGILVSQIQYIKSKKGYDIAIIDSGMSELIRPALYKVSHPILPLNRSGSSQYEYDVVGPICESGDFFAKKHKMPIVEEKDFLAVLHTGAYSSVMSSNYNSRPLIPELFITDIGLKVIRRPQRPEELYHLEEDI
ncbi:MAG: diaminopimelate decarboxylase [Leptospirales bacterium]